SWDFQKCLCETFNTFFNITADDAFDTVPDKLHAGGLQTEPSLKRQIVVDAKFRDLDQINFEANGGDLSLEVSRNDVQKLFSKVCVDLLREQSDENAKIANIARSFGTLKSALRLWFKSYAFPSSDDDVRYRIILADVMNRGANSVFRQLVTMTLKNHYPQRMDQLAERRAKAEEQETSTFVIRKTYAYSEEYEALDMKRCLFQPFYIGKNYDGRDNELAFAQYLDSQDCIEWWMKNGDSGRDWLSIRYFNEEEQRTTLFYPDWIYKKKDGTIGIWDTKGGRTASALETKNKAEELQRRIRQLNGYNRESIRYEGGIVIMANAQWYYNDSAIYTYKKGSTEGWKNMSKVFASR
ncbi:MAG: hypothetical protein J6W69_00090, partial [Bacteroidales bacterium]|nr:hypothetical protein [Bacteroidales bacterium]